MRQQGSAVVFWQPTGLNRVLAMGSAGLVASVMMLLVLANPAHAQDPTSFFGNAETGTTASVDHSAWTKLLQKYVVNGSDDLNRVTYRAFKSSGHKALKDYVATLQRVDPRQLGRAEQFAYWANLYNAKTIDVVLDNYPVKSIRDISLDDSFFGSLASTVGAGGPWKTKIMSVAGVDLSLDDIEHKILRPVFKDPRVHYAVNCASIGCPNLGREAFTGANLNAQLDAGARAFINSPRGFAVDGRSVTASSIYKWFQTDFGGSESGVIKHALLYASPKLKDALRSAKTISGYDYNWTLNDKK